MAELIGILIYVFAPKLIGVFTTGQKVLEIGVKQARTAALFYCLLSFSHCIAGICKGAGKAFVSMLIMLGVWCVFRIAYVTVVMSIKKEIGLLFMAYPITWFISSVMFMIYYKRSRWIEGFEI